MQRAARQALAETRSATPQSVAALRSAVVRFAERCGASARQSEDIAVAVSEALTNAVKHAYADADRPGVVAVNAQSDDGSLEVVVEDRGCGLRPHAGAPGLGLGLPLIAKLTTRHKIEDAMPGLRLRMTFELG